MDRPRNRNFGSKGLCKRRSVGRNRVSHAETHRPSELLATLKEQGFRVAVSVPDSWLGQLLVEIENDPDMTLIRATHEEEALAIACGSRLGGVRTVMLIQNVGLTTMGAGIWGSPWPSAVSSRY